MIQLGSLTYRQAHDGLGVRALAQLIGDECYGFSAWADQRAVEYSGSVVTPASVNCQKGSILTETAVKAAEGPATSFLSRDITNQFFGRVLRPILLAGGRRRAA